MGIVAEWRDNRLRQIVKGGNRQIDGQFDGLIGRQGNRMLTPAEGQVSSLGDRQTDSLIV